MLENYIRETLTKLHRSLDTTSFEELLEKTKTILTENHNHITCGDNIFAKLLALSYNHPNEPLALFFNLNPEQYHFVTMAPSVHDLLDFLNQHPQFNNPNYTVVRVTPKDIFVEENLY
jgi:hypothetical protein